ncbi:DUF5117 domain-containing protein [Halieaceae bacterium IMCC8485]|uniref:DUF5117 domain-containing protein n=1 Tax=Candidatus Seongchinamella marina TaxID=2518990 RepID=A0ABT3SWB5_9GAMM|nr:zinc-dependent metalloprotease [Candidatus Seongchinamella marina]MCX2974288.1 DUF5117 domain-containing protein [Candidatus Seongchinamella marina]
MDGLNRKFSILLLLACLLSACSGKSPPVSADAVLSYDQIIERSEHIEGFFDFYRDRATGETYLALEPDQLGTEFIYAAKFLDGISSNWASRGVHLDAVVLKLRRQFKNIEFLKVNVNYYHDPDSELFRSANANIQPALLAVAEIVAEDAESGRLLAKIDPVIISEALTPIKPALNPTDQPGAGFVLGEFKVEKSSIRDIRSYPQNSLVTASYVFEDPAPLVAPGSSSVDPRIVTFVLQHNFLAMPDDDFTPRLADPRVGFFTSQVTDMTSFSATPWRDPIQRWRLVKKDAGSALSEPEEPIVFWLENTTPKAFRDAVAAGVLAWNQAFEIAGFIDAIAVKVQPDDAEWDAEDIRYNVLRWTASSESPWGGYGPAFTNPRTGEVLGSDIMLEFGWLNAYNRRDRIYIDRESRPKNTSHHCDLGALRGQNGAFAALASNDTFNEDSEFIRQSVVDLVMHEVGHTLGLNHNFIASTYLTPEQLQDEQLTTERGVSSSVMDYTPANLAPPGRAQGRYFSDNVGIYDRWAIEFGYSEPLDNPEQEANRLATILSRSTLPGHAFSMDAETMNDSALGIDPRVLRYDSSADPVAAGRGMIALAYATEAKLMGRLAQEDTSWQEVYDAYGRLTAEIGNQGMIASRWIGGIFVDKSFQGQIGSELPLRPVPLMRQREAMALLEDDIFSPTAFSFSPEFYQHLLQTRRGSGFYKKPQEAQLHSRVLQQQKLALDHLLHPKVMLRIVDSQMYGNEYGLADMLRDLTAAIFDADLATSVNSLRQQLQGEYLNQLLAIISESSETGHSNMAQASALGQVVNIQEMLKGRSAVDPTTRSHTSVLLLKIKRALEP